MKQDQFLQVLAADEARRRWHAVLDLAPLPAEPVPLEEALGRILAEDLRAPDNVPAFDRSNVDGFAVRAADTYGASEAAPVRLRSVGTPLDAGVAPEGGIAPGEARPIATGGVLPRGADAVVMVEDTELEGEAVRIARPATPGARISAAGSDLTRGELVVRAGTRLTARETGTLAACGYAAIPCRRRPVVGVLSTGDEIVPPGRPLAPGQVHDANATLIADACRELGADVVRLGIAPDDATDLAARLDDALRHCDAVLLSGGTSKGSGDVSQRVVARSAQVVAHGVALKPGKPLCLAAKGGKAVAILPGFPTSAIFTFHAFVAPVLARKLGLELPPRTLRQARLARHLASEVGREDFTLVSLVHGRDGLLAVPLGSGSGSVTTFARADGFLRIPASVAFLEAGDPVDVTLLGRELEPSDLVVVGSHCTGLDTLLGAVIAQGHTVKTLSVGSRGGLEAARLGGADIAPLHLYDPETRTYNTPFVTEGLRLLRGYGRRQGLAYRSDTDLGEDGRAEGAADALRGAARRPELRLANRNPASGTYALLVDLLGDAQPRPPGWATAYRTHHAVAAAIAQGRADWGVCLESAARDAGLAWRPLQDERYDFLVPADRWDNPAVVAFRAALADPAIRTALQAQGFTP